MFSSSLIGSQRDLDRALDELQKKRPGQKRGLNLGERPLHLIRSILTLVILYLEPIKVVRPVLQSSAHRGQCRLQVEESHAKLLGHLLCPVMTSLRRLGQSPSWSRIVLSCCRLMIHRF
ncbi:uncharacterized protein AKAW2_31537A [Aspergillus luchuensis]|uniref:Uncharacterized protein n=1 Tax=Aspergillus kawachii TaxID=1069201 RepID=A0A7R7W8C8_ASPKA|nr:uncharacterized protein AKAW2_31537A [Aspergillus luchuensis]BCR98219.1 hypothetical protein AKAW2_31537A [Aspergillus luchuensis]